MSQDSVETVSDMSHSLSQELDRRNEDWRRGVQRMQRDFFKDNIDEPHTGDSAARTETASDGTMYQFLPDGSRVFRVRVNVRDLSPEELSVSTNDGQLVVSARQALSSGHGQRRRQVTKTFQLPDDVDADRLVSRLGNDGILTVEAPANPPNYQAVIKSRDSATTPPTCQSHTAYATDHATMSRDTDHAHVLPESQIITTDGGVDVLRVIVQLSRPDFLPNHIQVVTYDSKLRVVARQEMTSSSGVTSRREFTRELDVARPVYRATLRAVLQCGEVARLWIAAATMTSSPWRTTNDGDVAEAVWSVLPEDAEPVSVDLR